MKVLEKKPFGELLYNLKVGKSFLTMKQNLTTIEEKTDKFNCINVKSGHDKISSKK